MREMSAKGLGATAVVDAEGRAIGIFTDGDLRRLVETGADLRALTAADVMHDGPRTMRADALARRSGRADGAAPHHQRAGGRRRRRADRRAQHQRPDAREGHLMATSTFTTRDPARRAGHPHRLLRRRRRADRRRRLLQRARRNAQALQHPRRLRPQAAAQAGITPAVITGRDSKPLRVRLEALGIEHVRYGTEDKLPAAEAMLAALGFDWTQAAAIGDDWPDLPVLARVRLRGRAGQRACRGARHRAPRDHRARRRRRGARVLRPAADGRRPLPPPARRCARGPAA